jgi:membrane-associated phospholipid phosphatase
MQRERSVVVFLVGGVVLFVPGLLMVLNTEQLALHAWINARHLPWADVLFRYGTHLADGLVPTVLSLLLLGKDLRSFLMMGLSCGFSAIITQLLKRQVFDGHDRPAMFRAELGEMDWVSGLELNNHFSFPSGHATAALAMCFALAVIIGKPRWSWVMIALAGLLAFSRVYLSQHFTEDILAGAVIGTLTAWAVYRWLYISAFSERLFLDRSIFKRKQ